jgi:hypothetical protein
LQTHWSWRLQTGLVVVILRGTHESGGVSMKDRHVVARVAVAGACIVGTALLALAAVAAQPPGAPTVLGAAPPAEAMPRVEFAFEARVTLAPATVMGETGVGHRQYIPITGGTVAGPKFKGRSFRVDGTISCARVVVAAASRLTISGAPKMAPSSTFSMKG